MKPDNQLYLSTLFVLAALGMAVYSLVTHRVYSFAPGALLGMIERAAHPRAYWGFTAFYGLFGLVFGWMRVRLWLNLHRGGDGRD